MENNDVLLLLQKLILHSSHTACIVNPRKPTLKNDSFEVKKLLTFIWPIQGVTHGFRDAITDPGNLKYCIPLVNFCKQDKVEFNPDCS